MKLSPHVARRKALEAQRRAAAAAADAASASPDRPPGDPSFADGASMAGAEGSARPTDSAASSSEPPRPPRPHWRGYRDDLFEPFKYPHYTPELGNKICYMIACGQTMRSISTQPGMPSEKSLYRWLHSHEDFRTRYHLARRFACDRLDDESREIADDTSRDIVVLKDKDGKGREVLNPVAVQRAKTRVQVRQRIIDRYKPSRHDPRFDEHGSPTGIESADSGADTPAPFPILTEERRQQIIAQRRAAIEAMEGKVEG